ncbi:DUF4391 domain-containing protein [Clostridium algidicarnis]|uniref:DUF4391 domain-containing protein n=1 Tax=Clostridium algidicarnis TaxID=37659 RepID=UPI001C0AE1F4|nr:DUF4391 domain-containing protein [Clostridium algidicarnis]MBU3192630.1 DUF4391 domain-containing protein [Clostridium algidicarnis]
MFGLPKPTEINKQLPKKAIFEKFKPNAAERKLFDEQINRLSIVAEISPQTVSIAADEDVSAIYIILVLMKTVECDKKNIILLSKLIDQNMLFALQYEGNVKFAAYRANRVLMSDSKPIDEWEFKLKGLDLNATWDALVADVAQIEPVEDKDLDEIIIRNELQEKLKKQILVLEKKAMNERQPRRKWDLAEEIKQLKEQLKGV